MLTREVKLIQSTNPGESRRLLQELHYISASLGEERLCWEIIECPEHQQSACICKAQTSSSCAGAWTALSDGGALPDSSPVSRQCPLPPAHPWGHPGGKEKPQRGLKRGGGDGHQAGDFTRLPPCRKHWEYGDQAVRPSWGVSPLEMEQQSLLGHFCHVDVTLGSLEGKCCLQQTARQSWM